MQAGFERIDIGQRIIPRFEAALIAASWPLYALIVRLPADRDLRRPCFAALISAAGAIAARVILCLLLLDDGSATIATQNRVIRDLTFTARTYHFFTFIPLYKMWIA